MYRKFILTFFSFLTIFKVYILKIHISIVILERDVDGRQEISSIFKKLISLSTKIMILCIGRCMIAMFKNVYIVFVRATNRSKSFVSID